MRQKELHVRLGAKIRKARRSLDLTQGELAEKIGHNPHLSTICMWERGTRSPGLLHLRQLEKVLGPLWPVED